MSLVGALLVVGLKGGAFLLTGSVGVLSDATESFVNVASAIALIAAVRLAARPPDFEHPYGHQKAEYLSSVFEAAMILVAAGMILVTALGRLLDPQPLDNVALGLAVVVAASALNGGLAAYLARTGRALESPALVANARHVRTDVVTSLGVVAGVGLVSLTGWYVLDPLLAAMVAMHIVREGVRVLTTNVSRLMDERLPDEEEQAILETLERHPSVRGYHRLRTRRSGRARFAEVDVFVDGDLSVHDAHDLMGEVEGDLHDRLSELTATLHVEPYVEGVRDERRSPREEFPDDREPPSEPPAR